MSRPFEQGGARRGLLALLLAALACSFSLLDATRAHARIPPAPQLSAPAAAVFEASTGEPVFGKNAGQRRLIASTTKMMTALVTVSSVSLDHVCTAPPYYPTPAESLVGLRTGERMSVRDLLRAAMLPSANDAASALSVCVAGSRGAFVARMNRRAVALGLRHTHFSTPVGLDDPGNYSTAADLARLAIADRRNAFLRRTMNLPRATLTTGAIPRTVVNRNDLVLDVPWVNGVKTGHTNAAGNILAASGTQHGLTFVATVLGDPSETTRDDDALALLKWAFASFHMVKPIVRGATYAHASVKYRDDDHIPLVAKRAFRELLKRDAKVALRIDAPKQLTGPLPRGAAVGTAIVRANGKVIGRVPLVTERAVPEVGLLARVGQAIATPGSLVAIAVVLGGVAGAVVLLRRRDGRRRARRRADMEAA